jgi:ABC-2 type transport system ATP-binding protein
MVPQFPVTAALSAAPSGAYNRLPSMSVIEIRGLSKSYRVYQKKEGLGASIRGLFRRQYRDVQAVRGIDLDVQKGEFVAFLGPNGAGKTTTLKLLSGVITPTAGEARVLGFVPWERDNEYRRRFALVMGQKNQLWWDLPAQESFQLHQKIYHIDPAAFARTKDELVDLLGVGNLLGQPVRELSLGERMKMELIAALLHSPEVLFLDEPTIGLDVVAQHNIQKFLKHYQQVRGITILLTSHYMKDVAALCQRVVIIAGGQIVYDGSLDGVVDQFSNYKILTLEFADDSMPGDLAQFGDVLEVVPPRARLEVDRSQISRVLSTVLANHAMQDVSVEDPPLEEVIASLFALTERRGLPDAEDAERAAAIAANGAAEQQAAATRSGEP